jgi:chromosome segregation ATPase
LKNTVSNIPASTSSTAPSSQLNSMVFEKQQLEARLEGIQKELSVVQRQLQLEKKQVEIKAEQIRKLEDEITRENGHGDSQKSKLETALKLANDRIIEMQSNDDRSSKQLHELLDVVEKLKARISELEGQIERHREEEITVSTENQKLKSEIFTLKSENDNIMLRIKGFTDQITSLNRDLNEATKHEASLKLEIKKLEEEKHCLAVSNQPRLNGFSQNFDSSEQQSVTRLENELQMVTKRSERLKKELDSVYEQKIYVETELQSKTKELSSISEALHVNQTEVGKLREEKNRLETDLNTLLISKRTYEQRVNDLGDKLKMEQNMVRAFKSELQTREDDYNRRQSLQQELVDLRYV